MSKSRPPFCRKVLYRKDLVVDEGLEPPKSKHLIYSQAQLPLW